jgi:hypothetical protein
VIDSPGGRWVFSRTGILFDAVSQNEVKRWTQKPFPYRCGFSPDDKTMATADDKGDLTIWNLPTLKVRHVVPNVWLVNVNGDFLEPQGLGAFSPDNRTAALAKDEHTIVLVDLKEG